jgi:DNA-binding transcriptional MerR regulator
VEYRIDDLARTAGVTTRNIRAYQERGLLPPPRLEGRVGYYGEAHLARLRLIGHLLAQGYTLGLIARLIHGWEAGRDVRDLLGLEEALIGSWSDESPATVTGEQLAESFGPSAADHIPRAIALGVLEPDGDAFRVPSPRLLDAGAQLVAVGIPLPAVLDLLEGLIADIDAVARRLVEAVTEHLVDRSTDWAASSEQVRGLADAVRRLRPLAGIAVQAQLARSMQAAVGEQLGETISVVADDSKAS